MVIYYKYEIVTGFFEMVICFVGMVSIKFRTNKLKSYHMLCYVAKIKLFNNIVQY